METNAGPSLTPEEFKRFGYRAVDLVSDYLRTVSDRAVFEPMTASERSRLVGQGLPEAGRPIDAILDQFQQWVLPHAMGNGHRRFFGWVNSPPSHIGILAEMMAAAMNPSVAGGDQAAVYVERCVVRWLMELVGFPTEGSMGILVSGGSAASLTCLAAARHRAAREDGWDVRRDGLRGDRPRLVLYVSEEGHVCIRKAAELLGLGDVSVQCVPVDRDLRIDVSALGRLLLADREAGRRPFCVVANAGTVNTGAVDDLDALADLSVGEGLWLHVDGAYGAVGVLDESVRSLYRGLERVDSLAIDPHKWLSVPVECGCAVVRREEWLRNAFSLVPPYLRTEEGKGFGGLRWYSEYGFQQTRGFRALKTWMTLQHIGKAGATKLVSANIRLARYLARAIDQSEDLERVAPVTLSVVCFRYAPRGFTGSDSRVDALNKALVVTLQSEGQCFLSGTTLRGRSVLRACILHYATDEEDINVLIDSVRDAGARCVKSLSS